MMHVYLKTTLDEYELPVAVADTARELAEMVGTSQSVIYSSISHKHRGYYKVELEEDLSDWYSTNEGQLWRYREDSTVEYRD